MNTDDDMTTARLWAAQYAEDGYLLDKQTDTAGHFLGVLVVALDAATARAEAAEARVAEYENQLNWHTTCENCARLLDASYADHCRAEDLSAVLDRVRELHRWVEFQSGINGDRPVMSKLCYECSKHAHHGTYIPWPCPTLAVLPAVQVGATPGDEK